MSRIHILGSAGLNQYAVVVHAPVPGGNNGAGIAWQTAFVNSGFAKTSMPIGTGPGQITQSEADQIAAGTLFETTGVWGDDPSWTNAERQTDLNLRANQMVSDASAAFAARLKFYGFTVA